MNLNLTNPDGINLEMNQIPGKVDKIHLTAICGTGMGSLALMLNERGYQISGSDQNIYPPMSTQLINADIKIFQGFSSNNLRNPDLVIIGNAVSKNNPEVLAVMEQKLAFCSLPQAVNHFASGKKQLVVTGTHGKTTTSALLAWMLHTAGRNSGFIIGGLCKNFNSSYRWGSELVLEGDEYDTAFFDKGPKFLHYDPAMTILTSIEFDHADIYQNFDEVKKAFASLIQGLRPETTLWALHEDEIVRTLISKATCRVRTYGKSPEADLHLADIKIQPPWTSFKVFKAGQLWADLRTRLFGEHNLLNILAAIGVCQELSIAPQIIAQALETFTGIKRRQEICGIHRGITIMDDFAHHPTAVRETLKAVRPFYPKGRIIAVFEPRTNSSMRQIFQDIYPQVFDPADLICIKAPGLLHKIPPEQRFSSTKLVEDLRKAGKKSHHFITTDDTITFLLKQAKKGDLILIMSNGGFDDIHSRLVELLRSK